MKQADTMISKIALITLALALSSGTAFAAAATVPDVIPVTGAVPAGGDHNAQQAPSKSDCDAGWKAQSAMTQDDFNTACGK
jgi:hypothetical protein